MVLAWDSAEADAKTKTLTDDPRKNTGKRVGEVRQGKEGSPGKSSLSSKLTL